MKNHVLTFHQDGGHGWLQAPYRLLLDYDVETLISDYSYIQGSTVYLEEDADAQVLTRAILAAGDRITEHSEHHDTPCFIRNLDRYKPKVYKQIDSVEEINK